jgi:hypothetical protein
VVIIHDSDRDALPVATPRPAYDWCCQIPGTTQRGAKTPGRLFTRKAHAQCQALPVAPDCTDYQMHALGVK